MMRPPRGVPMLVALLTLPLAAWGCGQNPTPAPAPPGPQAGFPGGGPGGVPPGGPRGGSPMRPIMSRIGRGPTSLSARLEQELKADQPAWEAIEPQAAEYAKLTADLGKLDPPKGPKDSWSKLTAAFASSATALDEAAKARDLDAARSAQKKLGSSCMECHREHRGGPGGGPGGPGGPGSFGAGAFGGPPQAGQVLSPFVQDRLKLTAEQKEQLAGLQKEVDHKLETILTADQKKQLEETRQGFGRGGPGGPPGGPPEGDGDRPRRPGGEARPGDGGE